MNVKSTLGKFLNIPNSVTTITLCLLWKDIQLKIMILELLTIVCMIQKYDGHRLVLCGFNSLLRFHNGGDHDNEKFRFNTLVMILKRSKSDELKLIVMSFINAIVNSPSDIDVRLHLRQEFERRGLKQIMRLLKSPQISSSYSSSVLTDLEIQIHIYEEESAMDESEMMNRLTSELNCANFYSIEALITSLVTRTESCGLSHQFVRLLQSLLLLPVPKTTDEEGGGRGYECWDLAGRLVSQIALKKEEISVDDTSGFKLSLIELTQGIGELNIIQTSNPKDELSELKSKIRVLEGRLKDFEEIKSRLERSERGKKQLATTIEILKKKYDNGHSSIPLPELPSAEVCSSLGDCDFVAPPPLPAVPLLVEEFTLPLPPLPSGLPLSLPPLPTTTSIQLVLPLLPPLPDLPPSLPSLPMDSDKNQILELQTKITELNDIILSLQSQLALSSSSSCPLSSIPLPELPTISSSESNENALPSLPPLLPNTDQTPSSSYGSGTPPLSPRNSDKAPTPPSGTPNSKPAALPGREIEVKPKHKLKGFQWTALNTNKTKGTIWETLDATHHIPFQFDEIEQIFTAEPPLDDNNSKLRRNNKAASSTNKEQNNLRLPSEGVPEIVKIHLIEDRKVRNIEIMLARIGKGIPYYLIKRAILQMNESLVSPSVLQIIYDFYPSEDEFQAIKHFENPTQTLGDAEKFFSEMGEIPNLKERIKLQLFKIKFPERVGAILPELNAIRRASRGLLKSQHWKSVLEHVLLLGNFINFGTFRGGAFGFKLSSLLKLSDTKGISGQTLLHVLVKEIEKDRNNNHSNTTNFDVFEDLKYCEGAMKVSMSSLRNEMKQLKDGMEELSKGIEEVVQSDIAGDKWKDVMEKFKVKTEKLTKNLDNEFVLTEKSFMEVLNWFGEEVGESGTGKLEPEELFGMIWKFKSEYERVKAETKRKKMQEKQAEERAAAKEKRKMDLEIKKLVTGEMAGGIKRGIGIQEVEEEDEEVEEAVVDEILENLREGDVFRNRREKRERKRGVSTTMVVDEVFAEFAYNS